MVLDTARPKYKENTIRPGMRGKRCCKRVDTQGEHFTGIHDRFLRDPVYRESQLAIGWSEQRCKEWDELAKKGHTYKLTPEEKRRCKGQWYLNIENPGKNGPMKLRSDYRTTNQENQLKTPSIQVSKDAHDEDKKFSPKNTCPALELINIQDGNIGLHLHVPHGGTHPNGVGSELTFFCSFLLQLGSFTVDGDPL